MDGWKYSALSQINILQTIRYLGFYLWICLNFHLTLYYSAIVICNIASVT